MFQPGQSPVPWSSYGRKWDKTGATNIMMPASSRDNGNPQASFDNVASMKAVKIASPQSTINMQRGK